MTRVELGAGVVRRSSPADGTPRSGVCTGRFKYRRPVFLALWHSIKKCAGFFFFKKSVQSEGNINPEVPLYFGEGLRRSLGNAAGCGGGGQMGCAGLSFAFMFLCVETQLGAIS